MNRNDSARAFVVMLAMAAAVVQPLAAQPAGQAAGQEGWVCPPCACGQDHAVSDKPGSCPACRMKLIRKSEIQRVAILLYDGVEIIDYAAPWEVFGQAGFEVFTVTSTGAPITTAMGMKVTPGHSFENSPAPTILLVPGGGGQRAASADPATIAWVLKNAAAATHVLSVCNGALILAKAGLLDGQKATTFYYQLDQLRDSGKAIDVVTDQRWVDNGKIITSAGLSSGLDAAIHLVSKIRGLAAAQRVALVLEYDWKPDAGYARGALAEGHMPRLTGPEWETAEMLSTAGDRNQWEARYRMTTDLPADAMLSKLKTVLSNMRSWSPEAPGGQTTGARGAWTFVDDSGHDWLGSIRVEPIPDATGVWTIVLRVNRVASS